MEQRRILFIGAHPDDADILFGGTAVKLVRAGHVVKFVSATNGNTGHHIMSCEETTRVRFGETQASAKTLGISEYEVLIHNDCGIEATLEKRREICRVIRKFSPDIVITHRLCDYHPDHRATAQLVQDCTFVCMVPHFCEDTPIPEKTPIFAFSFDRFKEPRPHRPDAAIEIDSVMKEKLEAHKCHKSQFFEWLPWSGGDKSFDASMLKTEEDVFNHLLKWEARFIADNNEGVRERLIETYGEEKGKSIVYAETFEQSPYGRTVSKEEFQAILEGKE